MQITLKQVEIVEALKMYVQRQGLCLAGKTVDVSFTASRGNTGLLAEISIDSVEMPALQQDALDFQEARDALKVISCTREKTAEPEQAQEPQEEVTPKEAPSPSSLFS